MDLGLKGKVAVVTGTGSQIGFGRAITLALAKEGCNVAGFDIEENGAKQTAADAAKLGVKALGLKVDITSPDNVAAAVKQVLAEMGKIDILVNNAGMDPGWEPFLDMDLNNMRKAMEVNLYGSMNTVKAIAPGMVAQKSGKIVNFSGGQGAPQSTSYSCSKGAVDSWSDVLAKELNPKGVMVNTFLPPPAATKLGGHDETPEFFDRIAKMVPMGRLARPDEVGTIIAFLVSDVNSYMVGQYQKQ